MVTRVENVRTVAKAPEVAPESFVSASVGALVGGSVQETSKSDIETGPSSETALKTANGLI